MDVKTLSATIGHMSVATTLDIYAHSTDTMKKQAAQRIDAGFGRGVPPGGDIAPPTTQKPIASKFEPYKGKRRKAGTGCVSKISEHLWEGRYSPTWVDGKKLSQNVYAHSLEECEGKLAVLIIEMEAELAELRSKIDAA